MPDHNEHLHDPDQIAAHVDGLADNPELARRLIAECAECRAEFELQSQIKQMVASLPTITMTEVERERLHRAVGDLGRAKVFSLEERRRAQRWMRLASVAAGIFVVVGIGAVLAQMSSPSGGGEAFDLTAAELASPTTAAATEATSDGAATTAAAESAEEFIANGDATSARLLAGGDEEAVRAEIEALLVDDGARQALESYPQDADTGRCLEEGLTVIDMAESNLDGRDIVIYIYDEGERLAARVYDANTCDTIELAP